MNFHVEGGEEESGLMAAADKLDGYGEWRRGRQEGWRWERRSDNWKRVKMRALAENETRRDRGSKL